MKTFLIICRDKKNSLSIRLSNRSYHLDYLQNLEEKLILAGPLLESNGDPKGSVLIIMSENIEKLEEFLKEDPYVKADLFDSVVIEEFKRVF